MWRAVAKGTMLFAFGRIPGGASLYRTLTRRHLQTQATHVDKLRRVWPGYVKVWQERCGLRLEGADIWVHEGGWTPFPLLMNYLLTGRGGVVTNVEAQMLDQYLARAVQGALTVDIPAEWIPRDRRQPLEALRADETLATLLPRIGGTVHSHCRPEALPLESASVDLCHSGGTLEHYHPDALKAFLQECGRVLRPGGIASHVFDHRDHLFHADASYPFLAHLALSDSRYSFLFGHPLTYHNRLLPAEITALFEERGFEPIAVRRLIAPTRLYVEGEEALTGKLGIARKRLAPRFHSASEADLRTMAAHYLYRKV